MVQRSRYYLLGFYMAGFLIGILYANFIGVNYIASTGIFHEFFLSQYSNQDIMTTKYFLYLVRQRLCPVLLLAFSGMTKFRKIAAAFALLWTGFAGGSLAVTAVLRMGGAGMLYYLAVILPHCIFYAFAYAILICYLAEAPASKWNLWKTVFIVLSLAAGILTEAYINPQIVGWVMKIVG